MLKFEQPNEGGADFIEKGVKGTLETVEENLKEANRLLSEDYPKAKLGTLESGELPQQVIDKTKGLMFGDSLYSVERDLDRIKTNISQESYDLYAKRLKEATEQFDKTERLIDDEQKKHPNLQVV